MSRRLNSILMAVFCAGTVFSSTVIADDKRFFYEVTITNLTRGQSFTPILVSSHRKGVELFSLGSPVSDELAVLAESGNVVPLTTVLEANRRVVDTANSGGLLNPGESITVTVSASSGAKEISVAAMLIPTNDSFIALNGVKAPKGGKTEVYYSPGYDAGSEPNDELCANIPGPVCGGEGLSQNAGGEGYVHISSGITGKADLTADTYDWRNPTAKIVIKRIRQKKSDDDS